MSKIPKRERYEDAGPITDEDEEIYGRLWDNPEIHAQIAKESAERQALEDAAEKSEGKVDAEDVQPSDENRRVRARRFVWEEGDIVIIKKGAESAKLEEENTKEA